MRFSVGSIFLAILFVAGLCAIFLGPGSSTVSRTYTFSSQPETDTSLRNWLSDAGWKQANVQVDGDRVTISASASVFQLDGPRPDWESLGYQGGKLVGSSSGASKWLLPKLVGLVVLLTGIQIFRRRRANRLAG